MTGTVAALAGGILSAGVSPLTLDSAGQVDGGETVLFWVLAPLMVLGALGLLFARKAIHAALCVAFVMICLAFLYTAQDAPFLGVAQVVVYTGAVMMLFLFVLMLIGVDTSDSLVETIKGQRVISIVLGLGLTAILVGVIVKSAFPPAAGLDQANADSNPVGVARIIFGDHVFALEAVGALLITAALGALMLAHRQRLQPKTGQRERSVARVLDGRQITPLPTPGVYARHNAVDVPAIDAYGKPIVSSVSRVLRVRGQGNSISEFDIPTPFAEDDASLSEIREVTAVPSGAPDATAIGETGEPPADRDDETTDEKGGNER